MVIIAILINAVSTSKCHLDSFMYVPELQVQNAYDRRSRRKSHLKLTETSISKQHSRKSSDSGGQSKHSVNVLP